MPSAGITWRTSWTMRCGVQRSSVARSARCARMPSRSGSSAPAFGSLPSSRSASRRERAADVAHHLGLRKVDLLDRRRLVADVDHLRPVVVHDERRLLARVVADGDDQVGLLDGVVHVVALRERGGAHVELGAAGHRALAHLRREVGNARAQDELRQVRGRARPRGRGAEHDQRPLARRGSSAAARSSIAGAGDRQLERMRRHHAAPPRTSSPAMSSGSSSSTGPGRSSCATRKASRTSVGIVPVRDDLVRQLGQRLHRRDRCRRSGSAPGATPGCPSAR